MKTIRVFLSGCAVYLSVATIHACGGSTPSSTFITGASSTGGAGGSGGFGGSGGAKASASSAASGVGGSMTNPVGDALADSGSRIKAQWIVGDDGSKQFAGFYDSLRKEECYFYTMYDGSRRCFPLTNATGNYVGYYFDPMCSTPLSAFNVSACATVPVYAYSYPPIQGNLCVGGYKIFQTGLKVSPPDVYNLSGGTCVKSAPNPSYEYHLVGPEVPPSAFVLGTFTIDQ